jgi:hypothetical protein
VHVVTTIDQIASHARAALVSSSCLVGIDGFDGTGKTTLAFQLARQLAGIRVGLDSYIDKETPADDYVGLIRSEHLKRDIFNLVNLFPFVVVDGVCLLNALESVGVSPNRLVYVKKFSPQGLWHDGFHLENYIAGEPVDSWLAESVYGYHQAKQPHTKALICYHWTEA